MAPRGGPTISDAGWVCLITIGVLPLVAHGLFSMFGFNPTDDGFILAMSRRLLDGQVAHRDFISIRPVGSALLHAPWVLIGGEATYWLARLAVWFEFALIAWCWTRIAQILSGWSAPPIAALFVAWVAFVFSSHSFPIMPWHTIDGLALVAVGTLLALDRSPTHKTIGYLLIGAASLCKQNFFPVAPLTALILGDRRRTSVGIAALAPIALYGVYLLATGALAPALSQMSSQAGLREAGIDGYVHNRFLFLGLGLGVLVGAVGRPIRLGTRTWTVPPLLAPLVSFAILVATALSIFGPYRVFMDVSSFLMFGAVAGLTATHFAQRVETKGRARLGALALVGAWCASISLGLNSPALASGTLAVCLLMPLANRASIVCVPKWRWMPAVGAVAVACVCAASWTAARYRFIYRERPAAELSHALEGVWPGGGLLRTNTNTHELLSDLQLATLEARGRPFALVTDFPGYWAKSRERNPISIDWPQSTELQRPALRARVLDDLESLRGRGYVIVQRVAAGPVADGFSPLEDQSYYFAASYVRDHFRRRGETRWFDIYE